MLICCVVLCLYAEVYGKFCFFEKVVFLMYLYTVFVLAFCFPLVIEGVVEYIVLVCCVLHLYSLLVLFLL